MAYFPFFIFIITTTIFPISSSKPLLLPLSHSLSTSKYNSTHHLLKSTSTTSSARFHRLRHHHHVSLPISPGSDYTISLSLASTTISLYLDTGSDLVWLPCSPFECILCEGKNKPIPLNLSSSATSLPCNSRSCSAAHGHLPSSDLCAIARCPLESIELSNCDSFSCPDFYYAYGDGSLTGKLYSDDLIVPMSNPSLIIPNFTFGCSHTALGEPIGVAGFGRGVLSLPAQLSTDQFSYCLVSHSFDSAKVRRPSPLILGRYDRKTETQLSDNENDEIDSDFAYTPMLENPKHPYFYSVGLEAVTVGNRRIPAPASLRKVDRAGNGGMVVDSGTTYSMLPEKLYNSVVAVFHKRTGSRFKKASRVEERTGLGPCYYINGSVAGIVPRVVFHFGGNSSVVMPRRNYFYEFLDGGDEGNVKKKVGCMMLMNGGYFPESTGPTGLLGNYQQQGLEVVYDLEKKRVGFARRKCASLWDDLNQN